MSSNESSDDRARAVELLQQLGLKEYEAKCFVALSRVREATAKDISESSEVPRTRVYDAVRVLEAQGLVEVQHGNPQLFRAVPVEEAVTTLREQYESRFDTLQDTIEGLNRPPDTDDSVHEVWSLAGSTAIATRTQQLVADVTDELLFVLGDADLLDEDLVETLTEATDRGVEVLLGTTDEAVRDSVHEVVPDAEVFVSELDWLSRDPSGNPGDGVAIGRLLLADQSSILVSSLDTDTGEERAVYGRGFSNGLVVIVRRLMATGLLPTNDPQWSDDDDE